jgi:hypothetical protein
MDFKSLTTKKISGIPVIYIVLGVAVVALYGAFKLKPSAPASDAAATDSPDIQTDTAVDTSQPVFQATPTITQPSGVNTGSVTSTPMADTDELWKRRCVEYLVGQGFTLDVATSAITKYLNGEVLTATEARARDAAVKQYGIPPESVPGTATEPGTPTNIPTTPVYSGPASKQGNPPTTHRVRGTSDDSFSELARLYYGMTSGGAVTLIAAYNPTLNRTPIPVGTKVFIPHLIEPRWYVATSANRNLYDIARKNGTTPQRVQGLNPGMHFPVKVGTRVRVR